MQWSIDIIGVFWIVFWLYWLVSALRTRTRMARKGGLTYTIGLVIVLIAALVFLGSGRNNDAFLLSRFVADQPVVAITGIMITAAGLLFAVWARVHLGKNWSGIPMIKVGQVLVRSGPYQYVRNPIYTGIVVALIGTAMVFGIWIAVLAVAAGFAGILGKIHSEEKLLLETFGEDYVQYKREVKALIPFVV